MGLWFVVLWVLSVQYGEVDAFFDWLKKPAPAPAPPQESIATILLHGETPSFEMSVVDEKFLAEAKQMELSPMDSCHFRVSIMRMTSYFQEFHDQLITGNIKCMSSQFSVYNAIYNTYCFKAVCRQIHLNRTKI